jgi:hypothetical protein
MQSLSLSARRRHRVALKTEEENAESLDQRMRRLEPADCIGTYLERKPLAEATISRTPTRLSYITTTELETQIHSQTANRRPRQTKIPHEAQDDVSQRGLQ